MGRSHTECISRIVLHSALVDEEEEEVLQRVGRTSDGGV